MLPESEIGKNIRSARKLKQFTLEELAQKSGFSKGYLSKMENSDKAPPVSTLINLAKALDVNVSTLFGENQQHTSFSLIRKMERQLMARDGTLFGYSFETLAHSYPNKQMEPYILTVPFDIKELPLFQHEGEEMLFVQKGTVKFIHGENEYMLEEGDCIYFDSGIPHRGYATNGREAKALIVIFKP